MSKRFLGKDRQKELTLNQAKGFLMKRDWLFSRKVGRLLNPKYKIV